VSVVCGTTAGAADSKMSNQPITFVSNRIQSNLEALQVRDFIEVIVFFSKNTKCAQIPTVKTTVI